ncbi:MAG: TolC family protein [Acidobacteriota bacterium]
MPFLRRIGRAELCLWQAWQEAVPDIDENVLRTLASLGLERIETVAAGASLEAALQAIPSDTEAVYVTPLPHLSPGDFQSLAQTLVDRRLASFSLLGKREVEQGLLAALGPEDSNQRRARRVAIQVQEVLSGTPAEELPVGFLRAERLSINLATARAIGVSPRSALLIEADLLHEERTQAARTLSLSGVIRQASAVNLDLAAADRTVAAGLGLVREARSGLLPQLQINGGATFVDGDRAEILPTLGQRQYHLSLTGSQLIYSDQVLANYQIERNLQSLRQEERAQLRLGVILEGAESYLNVLRAQTVERIQKDNLELTRTNRNLARSRVEIGVAGREEVFRWESQIATNQKDVVDAQALRAQAGIAVNRVLNRPLEESFLTVEATLGDPELVSSFEGIGPYIESPAAFDVFSDFMAQEAFGASPELRQLDAAVGAQERAVSTARRDFFIPDVSLIADLTGFENGGRGAVGIPGFNAWDWTVRVDASLPIFQGGALRARLYRTRQELEELRLRRDATRQRVDQRVRSILLDTGASYIGIELSGRAAEAARRNLELVGDRYGEGVVGILVLLDAQNQALTAELAAANAVFDYLIDLMGMQRAAGRFDYYRSPQERQDYLNRVEAFFNQAGFRVRRP